MSNSTFERDGYREGFAGGEPWSVCNTVYDDEFMRGYNAGQEDRKLCEGLEATVIELLDGESIAQFDSFDAFSSWLGSVLVYEEMDQGHEQSDDRSNELLPLVYEKLHTEATQVANGKPFNGMRIG